MTAYGNHYQRPNRQQVLIQTNKQTNKPCFFAYEINHSTLVDFLPFYFPLSSFPTKPLLKTMAILENKHVHALRREKKKTFFGHLKGDKACQQTPQS